MPWDDGDDVIWIDCDRHVEVFVRETVVPLADAGVFLEVNESHIIR